MDQLQEIITGFLLGWGGVLTILIAFVSLLITAKSTYENAAAAEISNFLEIVKDCEHFSEDILNADNEDLREIRLSRYANYMECIAFLVNNGSFSKPLRSQVVEILVNFLIAAKYSKSWDTIFDNAARFNEQSFIELRKIEKAHYARIIGTLDRNKPDRNSILK